MKKLLIATLLTGSAPSVAFAHPGEHGMTVLNSLWHLLTEPDHLAMIAVGIIVVGVLFYKRSRRPV
jgi:hydrogenase/urease accessory protein HupE